MKRIFCSYISISLRALQLTAVIALGLVVAGTNARAAAGDLYVADSQNVYKFTPAAVKSTFATGFFQIVTLAFDRSGNLYVGNSGTGTVPRPATIEKVTPAGTKTTFATLQSTLLGAIAFDGAGNLFASTGFSIVKIAPNGAQSTFASNVPGSWPLAFDALGNLYVGSNPIGAPSILKFAPNGSRTTFITFSGGQSVAYLAFDANGNLFAGTASTIQKITPDGNTSLFASVTPQGLAFGPNGDLFAATLGFIGGAADVIRYTPAGVGTTFVSDPILPTALAFEPVTEKLRNFSARGFVQTGDNALIAGMVLGGSAVATNAVLFRALGPSLSHFGITTPLQDPVLELHNSSGAIIATNNNWQDTQRAQILATGLAPGNPHEAALYALLQAGAYTAVVRGVGNTTGVALVEAYSLNR
jgi:hypothetical protein